MGFLKKGNTLTSLSISNMKLYRTTTIGTQAAKLDPLLYYSVIPGSDIRTCMSGPQCRRVRGEMH